MAAARGGKSQSVFWRLSLPLALILYATRASAQEGSSDRAPLGGPKFRELSSADGPLLRQNSQANPSGAPGVEGKSNPSRVKPEDQAPKPADQAVPLSQQQPKRILGIMPKYRAVSAGATPPPPTAKEAFLIATHNSFDYSSFLFVGITSAWAEGTDSHPQLGRGLPGFGRYYWRGLADKTNGNYLVIFALPTLFHQDERYYALGEGGFRKRFAHSVSRIIVTPNYQGHSSFNA